MSRPLLISDCDEVLLHMVSHYAEWLDEEHGIHFALGRSYAEAATRDGVPVPMEELWGLLDRFFDGEMHRQNVVPGAVEALAAIAEVADIVILTNIGNDYHAGRVRQLETFDIRHRVLCNRGPKGRPVRELVRELKPSVALFVDDLAIHHTSVAEETSGVWRLHMVAEPKVAAHLPPAKDAHARIDVWDDARDWIIARFQEGPAPPDPLPSLRD